MNCMVKDKNWLLCHLARVVPAAGVFTSVLILSLRLQGDDGWLHLIWWLILMVSAALLALTSHRNFMEFKWGRTSAALAVFSVVRSWNEPQNQARSWATWQDKLKFVVVDCLRNLSLVAFVVAVGLPDPAQAKPFQDLEMVWPQQRSPTWYRRFSFPPRSWSSRSSIVLSEESQGPRDTVLPLQPAPIDFAYMGPGSGASDRSSAASDIILDYDPAQVAPEKTVWLDEQAQKVAPNPQYQDTSDDAS
ncbi:hypothetical protein CC79DRAFT_730138 [Sarocladium strictum]